MKRRLPTIIPPPKTVTFQHPKTTVILSGDLFNKIDFSSWQPKPANGNQLVTGIKNGYDCVLKVYGGVGDSGLPLSLQKMFQTEVKALTKLRNCENVLDLLHVNDQALWSEFNLRKPTLLFERCHLGNISMLVPSRGGLPIVYAKSLFDQLLNALEYCHLHRIAHTDVCLENMLLHSSGEMKLTGFSRSKVGGGARHLERSHVLDRERGKRSSTSTLGRYAWPPELRAESEHENEYDIFNDELNRKKSNNTDWDDSDFSDEEYDKNHNIDHEVEVKLHDINRKRIGQKPKNHDITKYDAYAGDVWSAAICLLVMCTGRVPFVSLSLPLTPQQLEDDDKPIDWALNAWKEGERGRNRFWEMLVSLQPTLLPELSKGFDDLLNGMMNIESWYRMSSKEAHAHPWIRFSGNLAKPNAIRTYVVNMIQPTLHGVSGEDGSVELKPTADMVRAQEEFSRKMIGNDGDDTDEEDDISMKSKDGKKDEKVSRKKISLGNNGLSFYQANVYAVRNAKRSTVEQLKRMNKTGKKQLIDSSERSALAQLGVQRAKQLAAEGNDIIYPHLETMWSRALGKQIMVRMPPIIINGGLEGVEISEQRKKNDHLNPNINLKELEKNLISASSEIINIYLRDDQTVLDIKKIMASRVVDEFPARWFDYTKHTLCLCGKALPDDLIIGSSTIFNRGNTVFRLFPTDSIPTNTKHTAHRLRLKEGRSYVQLFDYLYKYDQLAKKKRVNQLPQLNIWSYN